MNERHHRVWYWVLVVLAVVLTVLYAEHRSLIGRYLEYHAGIRQVQQAEQDLLRLDQEVAAFSERVKHLGSDPFELEAAGRSSKDLVRDGETIYRIQAPAAQGR